ncbi:MAG: bifunctional riboflavin kinase/FAD synthetase [Rhodospirillales bacterium]
MQIYREFKDLPADLRGAAIAVGNFDGVHKGHQAVINEAGRIARAETRPWAVLTFDPHPRQVFKPDTEPFRLTPGTAKERLIGALGVDYLMVLTFDKAFSQRAAEAFVKDILVEALGAHHVVSGYDFAFGQGRKGNCELLLRMGRTLGFDFTAVQAVHDEAGAVFSSTRVRDCLTAGDPQAAARILGRPFEIEGTVEKGEARGRTIGFPTANVAMGAYLRPANGVYAVRAALADGPGIRDIRWHDGVANLGLRPTFAGDNVVLEVHLFDFKGDLYAKTLRVAFIDYIRAEKKFDGIDGLKAQIARDCARARAILADAPNDTEAS